MRGLFVLLLAVAIFITEDTAAAKAPTRLLRTKQEDSEERRLTLPGFEKLPEVVKSGVSKLTTTAKLGKWRLSGKSADEVFVLLQLDSAGQNLFESPNFKKWATYMTMTNKKNPEGAMVSALSSRFGEKDLAEMLAAAAKNPDAKGLARKLQAQQFKSWVENGKSVDDVFKLLSLDKAGDLLTNPALETWTKYMNQFNKQNPGKETSMIKTFTTFYGDEKLSKMLEAAKKSPNTETLAEDLQTAQFKMWLDEGKKPAVVSSMLNINEQNWMANPDTKIWLAYKAVYKANNFKANKAKVV